MTIFQDFLYDRIGVGSIDQNMSNLLDFSEFVDSCLVAWNYGSNFFLALILLI